MEGINAAVVFRGTTHRFDLLPDTLLATLQAELENLTGVPTTLQKLIHKGKKFQDETSTTTLAQAGIKNGMKIQMLGTTVKDLDGMKVVEDERQKRDRILRERAMKPGVKVRPTGPGGNSIATLSSMNSSASTTQYKFHDIKPLEHLPSPETARAVLEKLATDPAIRHVMMKHRYAVGVLTELAPHEHPGLLGLNVNRGEAIKLRIRTDRYDGFRLYKDVRKVLCHELAHNVWGDHDNNFKELNSKLNREVLEYEKSVLEGARTLSGAPLSATTWGTSSEQEAEAQAFVLGGSEGSSYADSAEERRQRILNATMNRLQKEEEELEHSCGTGRPVGS